MNQLSLNYCTTSTPIYWQSHRNFATSEWLGLCFFKSFLQWTRSNYNPKYFWKSLVTTASGDYALLATSSLGISSGYFSGFLDISLICIPTSIVVHKTQPLFLNLYEVLLNTGTSTQLIATPTLELGDAGGGTVTSSGLTLTDYNFWDTHSMWNFAAFKPILHHTQLLPFSMYWLCKTSKCYCLWG